MSERRNAMKEILEGEERFLRAPKNDGNGKVGGGVSIGTLDQAGLD